MTREEHVRADHRNSKLVPHARELVERLESEPFQGPDYEAGCRDDVLECARSLVIADWMVSRCDGVARGDVPDCVLDDVFVGGEGEERGEEWWRFEADAWRGCAAHAGDVLKWAEHFMGLCDEARCHPLGMPYGFFTDRRSREESQRLYLRLLAEASAGARSMLGGSSDEDRRLWCRRLWCLPHIERRLSLLSRLSASDAGDGAIDLCLPKPYLAQPPLPPGQLRDECPYGEVPAALRGPSVFADLDERGISCDMSCVHVGRLYRSEGSSDG